MKKKLQVFVSSTYKDLKEERQAAVEAILKTGNIPAGMELFTAGNESQLQTITRWIDESDIYLLILGGRYGSIEKKSGQSYTEVEYDYAVSQNKPFFSVVITEAALGEKVKSNGTEVIEIENSTQYKLFREKVLTNISSFFSETKDIKLAIHETIQDFKDRYDFSGWVSGVLLEENDLLRKENNSLRTTIDEIKNNRENKVPKLKLISNDSVEENEFIEIEELFSKIIIKNKLVNNSNEGVSLIEIINSHKLKLVAGFYNRYGMGEMEQFFFFNIMPRLSIHGLAKMDKIPNVAYKHFVMTDKGNRFIAFLEMKQ